MAMSWASRMATGSGFILLPLGLRRKERVILLKMLVLFLLLSFCHHIFFGIDTLFKTRQKL